MTPPPRARAHRTPAATKQSTDQSPDAAHLQIALATHGFAGIFEDISKGAADTTAAKHFRQCIAKSTAGRTAEKSGQHAFRCSSTLR